MPFDENFTTKIDEASDTITYVGKAPRSSDTGALVWQIKKVTVAGDITTIAWANGSDRFDFEWDERTTYAYS